MFGMRFAPANCKLMLPDLIGPKPRVVLVRERLDELNKFSYLGVCTSPSGRILGEVSSRIQKVR